MWTEKLKEFIQSIIIQGYTNCRIFIRIIFRCWCSSCLLDAEDDRWEPSAGVAMHAVWEDISLHHKHEGSCGSQAPGGPVILMPRVP